MITWNKVGLGQYYQIMRSWRCRLQNKRSSRLSYKQRWVSGNLKYEIKNTTLYGGKYITNQY